MSEETFAQKKENKNVRRDYDLMHWSWSAYLEILNDNDEILYKKIIINSIAFYSFSYHSWKLNLVTVFYYYYIYIYLG